MFLPKINQLNDAEYAIPSVHTMPTLESVLNDLDENFDDLSDAEFFNTGSGSTHSFDNYQNSSILKHVLLQGVTTQLKSASVNFMKYIYCIFFFSNIVL